MPDHRQPETTNLELHRMNFVAAFERRVSFDLVMLLTFCFLALILKFSSIPAAYVKH